MTRRASLPPGTLGVALALGWCLCVLQQLRTGHAELSGVGTALRGAFAAVGLAEPLEPRLQTIAELRLWRALTSGFVGASLALGGALLQGLFRNGLAAPTVLGVNAGASLGAAGAILWIGGYAPIGLVFAPAATPYLITTCAFAGAT